MARARRQLTWMKDVKIGDVLQLPSGLQRVVRDVSRFKDGDLRALTFAIKRCSWTHRPETTLNYTDLRYLGYWHTGVNVQLTSPLDQELKADIDDHHRQKLDCCDVRGLP